MNFIKPVFWKKKNLIVFLLLPVTLITKFINILKKSSSTQIPKIKTICVGNIYLGGTGKTPLVIKISEILEKSYNTYVVKKYYKNQVDEQNLLKKKTKLILPKHRTREISKLGNSKKTVAIFDDGLQEKTLKHKISIVCFNSYTGIGNGFLLPAGPLRENLSELRNYTAAFINGKKNKLLENQIKSYNPNIKIFRGYYVIKNIKKLNIKSKYLAFCGIGTPESFFSMLKKNKIKIKKNLIFPDHFNYRREDINKIKKIASINNLKIITTEKDFIKLKNHKNFNINVAKINLKIEKELLFKNFLLKNL